MCSASAIASSAVLALRLAEDLGVEVLRAGEHVEPEHVDVGARELAEQRRDELGVHAELLRSAAHPHARALDPEVRVDPDRDPGADAQALAVGDDPRGLGRGLHLDGDPRRDGLRDLGLRLARAGEADVVGAASACRVPSLISAADATSNESTSPLRCWTTAGIGFALTA